MSRPLRIVRTSLLLTAAWLALLAIWVPAAAEEGGDVLRVIESKIEGERLTLTVEGHSGLAAFDASIDGEAVGAVIENTQIAPVTVIFAVETSSSMGNGRAARALEAVRSVVDTLQVGDSVALVTFGSTVDVLVAPTTDHALMIDTLVAHESSHASRLYDGVAAAFGLTESSDTPSHVVLLTRGWNFGAPASLTAAEALTQAEASGASGFVVALGADVDARLLDGVAALGGLPLGGDNVEELSSIALAIDTSRMVRYELAIALTGIVSGGAYELAITAAGGTVALSFDVPLATPPPVVPPVIAPVIPPVAAPSDPAPIEPPAAAPASPVAAPSAPSSEGVSSLLPVDPLVVAALLLMLVGALAWRLLGARRRGRGVANRPRPTSVVPGRGGSDPKSHLEIVASDPAARPAVIASVVEDAPAPSSRGPTAETVRVVMTLPHGEQHDFNVGHEPMTVGRSPMAEVRLTSPRGAFIHSVLILEDDDRVVAVILAADGAGPLRVVLKTEVPTDIAGCRFELPDGATAAA